MFRKEWVLDTLVWFACSADAADSFFLAYIYLGVVFHVTPEPPFYKILHILISDKHTHIYSQCIFIINLYVLRLWICCCVVLCSLLRPTRIYIVAAIVTIHSNEPLKLRFYNHLKVHAHTWACNPNIDLDKCRRTSMYSFKNLVVLMWG